LRAGTDRRVEGDATVKYAELYNRQYAETELMGASPAFAGLRRVLAPFDVDLTVEQLALRLLPRGGVFVDAGSGDGKLCFLLESRYQQVIGLDVATTRLNRAQQRVNSEFAVIADKFSFLEADLDQRLPLLDSSVDVLCSLNVIEHVFDIYSITREFHRVLKPGGHCLFQVPNIGYLKHRLRLLVGKLPVTSSPNNWPEIGWDGGHLHYFTMGTFCELLVHAGFSVVHRTGTGLLGNFRNWWPSLLTGDLVVLARK
jgi:SAM-dependent methyltransferase